MILLFYILAILISGSLSLLGLLVYLNNPKSATNKAFLLMALASAGSALGVYLAETATSSDVAFFWVKFLMVFASWASPAILLFIYTFPKETFKHNKVLVFAEIGLATFFSIAAVSGLMYKNVEITSEGTLKATLGPVLPLFGLVFGMHLIALSTRLFDRFRHATGKEKEQFRYLAYGLVLMLLFVGVFDIFFILFLGKTDFAPLGVSSFLLLEGAVFYSITRHRLLDIRLVVARTVAYTLLVGIIAAFYTGVTFLATSLLFQTTTNLQQTILYGALTLIVAFTFQPLRRLLEETTNKVFYKGHYDSSEILSNLTKVMVTALGLKSLTEGLLVRMLPEMRIGKGAFVLLDKGKIDHIEKTGFDPKTKFVEIDIHALLETRKILIFDEVRQPKMKKIMRELDITVSVPLKVGSNELGLLLLGHKLSGEIYTDQDIGVLSILSPETSIAIENARAYEEIRKFSVTLQKEVEKATGDLRHANERLKELDELKDEFMSIASHELRTPMTAIKSYVWLALNGKGGELGMKVRSYLTKVYESSDRMIAMINDMLNVSRIETGRLQLDIVPISVYKIADQVAEDLSAKAGEGEVKVVIKKDALAPLVLADRDKLMEIFTNLIGNSLKFTKKGGKITVAAEKKDAMVQVSVADTGVGISKENIPKLFKKYGKLGESYATASASTGTGLGLFITKQYLEKMNGKIWVESTLGKGTTFSFSLPIATGAVKEAKEKETAAFVPKSIIR